MIEIVIAIIFGAVCGTAIEKQSHFNECEKVYFVGEMCQDQRSLCLSGNKKDRCYPPTINEGD